MVPKISKTKAPMQMTSNGLDLLDFRLMPLHIPCRGLERQILIVASWWICSHSYELAILNWVRAPKWPMLRCTRPYCPSLICIYTLLRRKSVCCSRATVDSIASPTISMWMPSNIDIFFCVERERKTRKNEKPIDFGGQFSNSPCNRYNCIDVNQLFEMITIKCSTTCITNLYISNWRLAVALITVYEPIKRQLLSFSLTLSQNCNYYAKCFGHSDFAWNEGTYRVFVCTVS